MLQGRLRESIVTLLRRPLLRKAIIPPLHGYFRSFPIRSGKVAIWETVASHLWWLEDRINTQTSFGSRIEVDARDGCGRFIYYFGLWEPNLTAFIRSRLRPGDCFVDVGANVGYFSLLSSQLVGASGMVVSIEAVPRTYELLKRNIEANELKNVRTLNVAVWDKEEELTFFISRDVIDCTSTAMTTIAEGRGLKEQCRVPAACLSSLLKPEEVAVTRLMKIDVEGAERHAIRGFDQILEQLRKDVEIVIEVTAEAFDDVASFFRQHGFFCYHLENDYGVTSYINQGVMPRLQRIEVSPLGHTHLDLIFSRTDADKLEL